MVLRSFAASPSGRDPVQQLFLDKIAEYRKKAASAPNGLVDADENTRKALIEENERIRRTYNIKDGQEDVLTSKFSDDQFQPESINMKDWK